MNDLNQTFDRLVDIVLSQLQPDEHLKLNLVGEQSQFVRFNGAKVRQTGSVIDGDLSLTLMFKQRSSTRSVPFTGYWETDQHHVNVALEDLRQEVIQLPEDPFVVLPEGDATSQETHTGHLLQPDAIAPAVLPAVEGLDFTGIYAGGTVIRAYADSAGRKHWFSTDSFALDYSLFTPNGQAVKGTFAGNQWDQTAYAQKLVDSRQQLDRLVQPPKPIARGQYRTYLAPAAMADLISILSWGGVGEASLQQGGSALALLQRGEKQLSPIFNLSEDFSQGLVPRFNEWGEIAPVTLPIIQSGKLINTLINSRTAKEYHKTANGANGSESLRSPVVAKGTLSTADVLKAIDTGLYLSNLHYLNWSDRPSGRITGMTRYACFWVENGEIVAPIENLRFDESLYRFWGENLLALTDAPEFIPEVGTYSNRDIGGIWVPGALIEDFTYTL